jgi:YVTN family beta-propeller protein
MRARPETRPKSHQIPSYNPSVTSVRSPAAPATAASGVRFRVLGRLEASRDGVPIELGTRKQRAVLALLLLNANRVVATERLIDELWGDSPPAAARSALQVYIAGLRKALGNDGAMIRTKPPGYVLQLEPGALDLDRFAELRDAARAEGGSEGKAALLHEALSLWHDAPLAELGAEPFAGAIVPHLEQLRLGALEERIDADLDLGRHAALVPELEALVAEHPYRERLRAQLMLALYRSGRQAEALHAYQEGRRLLRDELGLEPGHELRELEGAILRQDTSLAGTVRPAVPAGENGSAVARPHTARRTGRRRGGLLAAIALALVAAPTTVLVLRDEASPALTAPPNSLAVIDADSGKVAAALPLTPRPGPIAEGGGSLWVGSVEERALIRIDPRSRRIVRTIPLPATPTGIAYGFDAVWVAHGRSGQLSRVDPKFNRVTRTIELTGRALYSPSGSVAVGAGWVWVVFGDSTFVRVDPFTVRASGSTLAGVAPSAVVVHGGSVWVANAGDSTVQRYDPLTFEEGPVKPLTVGRTPSGMAVGEDAIWVTLSGDDSVARIDPGANSVLTIPVGRRPEAVAAGPGVVWIANAGDSTVSRIDPATKEEVERVAIGNAPRGIAVVDRFVHVTVQSP